MPQPPPPPPNLFLAELQLANQDGRKDEPSDAACTEQALAEELYQEGDSMPEYQASPNGKRALLNELQGEEQVLLSDELVVPFTEQVLGRELHQEGDLPDYQESSTSKHALGNELQREDPSNDAENASKQILLNEMEDAGSGIDAEKGTESTRRPGAYSVRLTSTSGQDDQDDLELQQEQALKAEVVDEEVVRTQARKEAREEIYKGIVPAKAVSLVENEANGNGQSKNRTPLVLLGGVLLLALVIGLAVGLTQRNKNGNDQITLTLAPTGVVFTDEPTMAPTHDFDENDICALAPPIPGDAGPEVVYTGYLSNTTARNETIGVAKLPFNGYKRWYDLTRVGGKRMTMKFCARLDVPFLEELGFESLNIGFFLFEGVAACPSTEEPLEYDGFELVFSEGWQDEPIGGDPPLLCHSISYATIPGSEYTCAFLLLDEERSDLAEDTFFNFSIALNDHCDYAAEVFPEIPIQGSNQFGRPGTADLPVCDGVDIFGKPGTWYKVRGTGGTLIASTCEGGSVTTDTLISVFGSSCDKLSCIGANEDSGGRNIKCGRRSKVSWTSVANMTYYIVVAPGEEEELTAQGDGGEFTLTLKSTAPENLCTGALALEAGDAMDVYFTFDGDIYTERCWRRREEDSWVDRGIWLSYVGIGKQVGLEVVSCNDKFDTFGVSVYTSGPSCSPLDCVEEIANADTREIVAVEEATNCTSYIFGEFLAEDGVSYKLLLYNLLGTNWESFPPSSLSVTLLEEE